MINFNKAFEESAVLYNTEDVLVDDLTRFVRKELSLKTLRQYWKDPVLVNGSFNTLKVIYALEKVGVDKARNLARRALNRRGYKVRNNGNV